MSDGKQRPTTRAARKAMVKKPNPPRRRRVSLDVLTIEARRTAAMLKKGGGALAVVEQTYHAGLVTGAALMSDMAEWANSKATADLDTADRLGLLGSLPKFVAALETLGEALRDRRHEAAAAAIPPEPPRAAPAPVPVIGQGVPMEVVIVPVDADPVPLEGEIVPNDPRDRLFDHPEMRKIIEAGQRFMDERRIERRQAEPATRRKS